MDDDNAPRILALWCPDWPVVAAAELEGLPRHRPAAVVAANRVVACSAPARTRGVRRGLRRREAQARCPGLAVLPADPGRDARMFERVACAVEEMAPGVEVVRPGLVALLAQGPVAYFGGTRAAAEQLIDHVAGRTGAECQVGIADGLFAATLAAHRGLVVEPGRTREFLAPLPVAELDREPGVDRAELISLLNRLGLRSLGAFASLPAADVASRFGSDAVLAHRLALGLDPRPPARRRPTQQLSVVAELDPPVTRVDAAAFAARGLAERLHELLARHGLACTRLGIQARTVHGGELSRVWRCAEPLTPAGTVDRVRWQLEAWLTRKLVGRAEVGAEVGAVGSGEGSETAGGVDSACAESDGIAVLRLSGEEVVAAGALQLGLWGDVGVADERAARALVRVQALLGPEEVCTAVLDGGRDPAERVRLVTWGERREPAATARSARGGPGSPRIGLPRRGRSPTGLSRAPVQSMLPPGTGHAAGSVASSAVPGLAPWPGRLPAPSPTTVLAPPVPAEVLDEAGRLVGVTERDALTSVPATVAVNGGCPFPVRAWAGPWPLNQRWWEQDNPGRGSRLQVVLDAGVGDGVGKAGELGLVASTGMGGADETADDTADEAVTMNKSAQARPRSEDSSCRPPAVGSGPSVERGCDSQAPGSSPPATSDLKPRRGTPWRRGEPSCAVGHGEDPRTSTVSGLGIPAVNDREDVNVSAGRPRVIAAPDEVLVGGDELALLMFCHAGRWSVTGMYG